MNFKFIILIVVQLLYSFRSINCFSVTSSSYVARFPTLSTPFDKGEKCYGELGCFTRFPPCRTWSTIADAFRIGFYPDPPQEIDTYFYLYTCSNRYRPNVMPWNVTDEELEKSSYDSEKRTIFIIHGFKDNYDEMNWMGDMKDFILNIQNRMSEHDGICDKNVIGVDWRGGSQVSLYMQAVANTQIVGAAITRLINQLIRLYPPNVKVDDFTLVGHSLGAHAAGFVGTHFRGDDQIHNIIGLDPAGPAFADIPNSHRLDPSDAKLVLTIHTNGGQVSDENFGIMTPLGHYSFYPNGGTQQPGCERTRTITNILLDGLVNGLTDSVACNHRRATHFVQVNESLYTTAESMAYACRSYQDFQLGRCGSCIGRTSDRCKPFGGWFTWWQEQSVPSDWEKSIRYFIDTTDNTISLFHFQIILRTRDNFKRLNNSYIRIIPIGELRNGRQITIDPGTIEPNSTYTYLLKVPKDLGTINMAMIKVKQKVGNAFQRTFGLEQERDYDSTDIVRDVKVNFMSHYSTRVRQRRSSRLEVNTGAELNVSNRKLGFIFVAV